jgi:hypothetical protein
MRDSKGFHALYELLVVSPAVLGIRRRGGTPLRGGDPRVGADTEGGGPGDRRLAPVRANAFQGKVALDIATAWGSSFRRPPHGSGPSARGRRRKYGNGLRTAGDHARRGTACVSPDARLESLVEHRDDRNPAGRTLPRSPPGEPALDGGGPTRCGCGRPTLVSFGPYGTTSSGTLYVNDGSRGVLRGRPLRPVVTLARVALASAGAPMDAVIDLPRVPSDEPAVGAARAGVPCDRTSSRWPRGRPPARSRGPTAKRSAQPAVCAARSREPGRALRGGRHGARLRSPGPPRARDGAHEPPSRSGTTCTWPGDWDASTPEGVPAARGAPGRRLEGARGRCSARIPG